MTSKGTPARTRSVAIRLAIAVFAVIAVINEVSHRTKTAEVAPSTHGFTIPRDRWDDLATWVKHCGSSVEPYDPSDPNTLRIRISEKEVATMTAEKAQRVAEGGLDMLGEGGTVCVLSPSGRLIGKSHL